ncbi:hypothetical protein Bpfe_029931, partial [Biomphalaria pfeifferi]
MSYNNTPPNDNSHTSLPGLEYGATYDGHNTNNFVNEPDNVTLPIINSTNSESDVITHVDNDHTVSGAHGAQSGPHEASNAATVLDRRLDLIIGIPEEIPVQETREIVQADFDEIPEEIPVQVIREILQESSIQTDFDVPDVFILREHVDYSPPIFPPQDIDLSRRHAARRRAQRFASCLTCFQHPVM